jgi:hypothetical protein
VPVEEDEVRFACLVDHLINPDQPLDGRPAAAFLEWVEVEDSDYLPLRRRFPLKWPASHPPVSGVPVSLGLR